MDCSTQEPTMRRVMKVTNVYNPYQYTYPCNNLSQKGTKFIQLLFQWCCFIICSQHEISYAPHGSVSANSNNNSSCPARDDHGTLEINMDEKLYRTSKAKHI
uniref:Calcium-transporting ATPase 3 endoplasmic reticulum-type n=1 Tax=Rhizophora mucronata TaxID=61149 RepID=A0A2P2M3J6_RHIMU